MVECEVERRPTAAARRREEYGGASAGRVVGDYYASRQCYDSRVVVVIGF